MVKIYFDGCAGPTNPGFGGAGVVVVQGDKKIGGYWYLGEKRTNNEAEYAALFYALKLGKKLKVHNNHVNIYGDSQLVINQVNSVWKNKKLHLQRLMGMVHSELSDYTSWSLEWIPREQNALADQMSVRPLLEKNIKIRK